MFVSTRCRVACMCSRSTTTSPAVEPACCCSPSASLWPSAGFTVQIPTPILLSSNLFSPLLYLTSLPLLSYNFLSLLLCFLSISFLSFFSFVLSVLLPSLFYLTFHFLLSFPFFLSFPLFSSNFPFFRVVSFPFLLSSPLFLSLFPLPCLPSTLTSSPLFSPVIPCFPCFCSLSLLLISSSSYLTFHFFLSCPLFSNPCFSFPFLSTSPTPSSSLSPFLLLSLLCPFLFSSLLFFVSFFFLSFPVFPSSTASHSLFVVFIF